MNYTIVIPAFNPCQKLIALTDELIRMGADKIVVVNDGSDPAHADVFQQLDQGIIILQHQANRGKGAALKTAFTYCVEHQDDMAGIITADCDGQHTPHDIFVIAAALSRDPDSLILGVRAFDKATTPARSYFGNKMTSRLFNFLYHININDTQTGLRGIPVAELEWMLKIPGQKYEYELDMLIRAKRRNVKIKQVSVEIVYFDNNRSSNYKTVRDSLRIAKVLFSNLLNRTDSKKHYYGGLFYFCRGVLRLFNRRLAVEGRLPTNPVILIGHHQNLKGALRIMMWLNIPVRIWVLGVFFHKKSCFEQYAGFTLTQRMGFPKFFARAAARVISCFMPKLVESMRAIPVYRRSARDMRITMDQSLAALRNGENLLIFPDIDYTNESDQMGEMYLGFVSLDRYYYKETGKHIDFIPIRVEMNNRRMSFGKSTRIEDGEDFTQAKNRVGAELLKEINSP